MIGWIWTIIDNESCLPPKQVFCSWMSKNEVKIPRQPVKNFLWNILHATDFYSGLKSFSVSNAMKHFYSNISLSSSKASGFWLLTALGLVMLKMEQGLVLFQ